MDVPPLTLKEIFQNAKMVKKNNFNQNSFIASWTGNRFYNLLFSPKREGVVELNSLMSKPNLSLPKDNALFHTTNFSGAPIRFGMGVSIVSFDLSKLYKP